MRASRSRRPSASSPGRAHRVLVLLAYPDQFDAADQVPELLAARADRARGGRLDRDREHAPARDQRPRARPLPARRRVAPRRVRRRHARRGAREGARGRRPGGRTTLFTDYAEQKRVWLVRESAIGASRVPGELETWSCWEDSAVHPDRLGAYLRDFQSRPRPPRLPVRLLRPLRATAASTRGSRSTSSPPTACAAFRAFMEEASDLVPRRYGGSLSGEHGDGQSHAELLPKMFGPELVEAFREFKRDLGPRLQDEPGQGRRPVPARLEPPPRRRLPPARPKTHFRFPRDGGELRGGDRALLRRRQVPAHRGRDDVPELTWSRARRCTRRAGARTCSSSCCAAR